MIRLDVSVNALPEGERFGLEVLLQTSRIARTSIRGDAVKVCRLQIDDDLVESNLSSLRNSNWSIRGEDGVVFVRRDLLRWVARVCGAEAEQKSTQCDRYGRVPSSENDAVKAKLERTPVASEAGKALRDAVTQVAGDRLLRFLPAWPSRKTWAIAWTHDLDGLHHWPLFWGVRFVESLKRSHFQLAAQILGRAPKCLSSNQLEKGVENLIELHDRAATPATWFVICEEPTIRSILKGDSTYSPRSKLLREVIDRISSNGHEVGLHGSFETALDADLMQRQKLALEELVRTRIRGVRQHFLSMRPGRTQVAMRHVGFEYDSTYGFPDRNGFRLGIAEPVMAWNSEASSPIELAEIPFCWMDRALSKYQRVEDPVMWMEDAKSLSRYVRELGGAFVSIWHPHLTDVLGYPGAFREYSNLHRELSQDSSAFTGTLSEIVEWKKSIRSVNIVEERGGRGWRAYSSKPIPRGTTLLDRENRPVETIDFRQETCP